MNWLFWLVLCRFGGAGLVFYSWFQILCSRSAVISGGCGCVCFCFTSTESLILAQDERWRRA
jgi:hypothetical protein